MSEEKTEQASAKKLRKARQEGKVAKSTEFTSTAVALAALAALLLSADVVAAEMIGIFEKTIALATTPDVETSAVTPMLIEIVFTTGRVLAPVLAAAFVIAAFVSYLQAGPVFAVKPLIPDANRMNPAQGFKNLFNKDKLVELSKNVAKLTVMGAVGASVFVDQLPALLRTSRLRLVDAMAIFGEAAFELSSYLVGGLVAFAVIDLIWQRHKFAKEMMMSKKDLKDEYKESEGSPETKGRRRQLHRELLNSASVVRVKDADAVVVNPTHIAVALQYEAEEMDAPVILTKGRGERAAQLRQLARRYGVPIVRDVPLARALIDLDDEDAIPEELYEPVAEVLRYVYSLGEPS